MPKRIEGRLQTQALPVDDLVDSVISGQIRIPSFQRGLRWNRQDVIKLFDSIVLGYPIGNLLLWKRHAEAASNLRIGALLIDAPATDSALFVVDGQQRLTSLANALTEDGHLDSKFALSYDVVKEQFVPRTDKSAFEIPLPVIFDLTRLLTWFSDNPELLSEPQFINRANDVAKAIREFRVPIYIVEQSDADVLRDIFDRMNNYGKQLSRAEIFSALHERGSDEDAEGTGSTDLGRISTEVHAATGYGVVDEDTILLAMLARRSPDISRDIRKEFVADSTSKQDFKGETPEEARNRLTVALISAIRFLQDDARAPHFAFLPYRYLLVVLTRFFAHFEAPSPGSRRNLRRWFWRAASMGPELTKGNITYATRSLCSKIIPGNESGSVEGLLALVGDAPNARLDVSDFKTNWAATRILLAALWAKKPRRLVMVGDSSAYSDDDLLAALGEGSSALDQAVTIFTRQIFEKKERALPSNRVLLAETSGEIPESILDSIWALALSATAGDSDAADILASHVISPAAAAKLVHDDAHGFLELRYADITAVLEAFLNANAEWRYEDTPPLATLNLDEEEGVRDDELRIDSQVG